MELNRDLLRWVLLIGAAPIWWPFLRILWRDFNSALREEGGLLGNPPGRRELDLLRRTRPSEDDPLHSQPRIDPRDRRRPRLRDATGTRPAPEHRDPPPKPPRRGFGA